MKVKTSRRSRNVSLEMEAKDVALPPIPLPELQIRRILAPVDFSDCSHKAFQYAIHFARQFNAELMLLHVVVTALPPTQMVIFESERVNAEYSEHAARLLADWRNEAVPGVSVKAVTRGGAAAPQEIVDAARESNSDLIIIGNHGRTGLARWVMGGTAERVVRHAPCPVLVIREREHDFVTGQMERSAGRTPEASRAHAE